MYASSACPLGNRLNSSCISTLQVHPYPLILSTTVVLQRNCSAAAATTNSVENTIHREYQDSSLHFRNRHHTEWL